MRALDDPSGQSARPTRGIQRAENPVPQSGGLMDGHDGVEVGRIVLAGCCCEHHEKVYAFGIEIGMFVESRVLEGVFPSVRETFLSAIDAVHRSQPFAGLAVADRIEQNVQLIAEDGSGDELAILHALDELAVGVHQSQVGQSAAAARGPRQLPSTAACAARIAQRRSQRARSLEPVRSVVFPWASPFLDQFDGTPVESGDNGDAAQRLFGEDKRVPPFAALAGSSATWFHMRVRGNGSCRDGDSNWLGTVNARKSQHQKNRELTEHDVLVMRSRFLKSMDVSGIEGGCRRIEEMRFARDATKLNRRLAPRE